MKTLQCINKVLDCSIFLNFGLRRHRKAKHLKDFAVISHFSNFAPNLLKIMTRKRNNTERVLTNAEKCKRYREKNSERYKKEDALNKRYKRMDMAANNPEANLKRLKEQAAKKRLYRQKKKMEKEQESSVSVIDETLSSSTPAETPATPVYSDQPTSTSTPDPSVSTSLSITPSMKSLKSSFSQKSTRARSLKRAAEALPKSPRKKREVLETLATNVLKIKSTISF